MNGKRKEKGIEKDHKGLIVVGVGKKRSKVREQKEKERHQKLMNSRVGGVLEKAAGILKYSIEKEYAEKVVGHELPNADETQNMSKSLALAEMEGIWDNYIKTGQISKEAKGVLIGGCFDEGLMELLYFGCEATTETKEEADNKMLEVLRELTKQGGVA